MCTIADLPLGDVGGFFPLLLRDHVFEQPRADDVGPFADNQRTVGFVGFDQVDAGIKRALGTVACGARLLAIHHLRDGFDVFGRGAAASANQIQPAVVDKLFELRGEHTGRQIILAFNVGQAGVGVAGNARVRKLVNGADVIRHELRSCGAIEAEGEQVHMGN